MWCVKIAEEQINNGNLWSPESAGFGKFHHTAHECRSCNGWELKLDDCIFTSFCELSWKTHRKVLSTPLKSFFKSLLSHVHPFLTRPFLGPVSIRNISIKINLESVCALDHQRRPVVCYPVDSHWRWEGFHLNTYLHFVRFMLLCFFAGVNSKGCYRIFEGYSEPCEPLAHCSLLVSKRVPVWHSFGVYGLLGTDQRVFANISSHLGR